MRRRLLQFGPLVAVLAFLVVNEVLGQTGQTQIVPNLSLTNYLLSNGSVALQAVIMDSAGEIASIGGGAQITDGTDFSASSTTGNGAMVRTDVVPIGAIADGEMTPARVGAYGELRIVAIDPATGDVLPFTEQAEHGQAANDNGDQLLGAYRADLSATAGAANAAAVRLLFDDLGRILGGPKCPGASAIDGQAAITDGSSTSLVAAQGANIVAEIWTLRVGNSSASFVTVDIRDGAAGAVLDTIALPAGAAGTITVDPPYRTTANTLLAADPSAAASTITLSARGCKTR